MAAKFVEQKQNDSNVPNPIVLTWDGLPFKPTTHIVLRAWNASDKTIEAIDLFLEHIYKVTQRRFNAVPDANWLRNENIHSKPTNDGARCRIPVIIGHCSSLFDRLSFKNEAKQSVVAKVKYQSKVYMPGLNSDNTPTQFVDHALIVTADEENIKSFITELNQKITDKVQGVQKGTNESKLSLEQCLNVQQY